MTSQDRHAGDLRLPIGGAIIEGWLEAPPCPACGGTAVYYLAYDATCCPQCNRWLELRCASPYCVHCLNRPERPFRRAAPVEPHATRGGGAAGGTTPITGHG